MKIPKFPKELATQSIVYLPKSTELDDWGQPTKTDKVAINQCVVQPTTIYSGNNNNREIVANAVVFLYQGVTTPMPTLGRNDVGSKIEYGGDTYTVTKIDTNINPYTNEVWSYELEVI